MATSPNQVNVIVDTSVRNNQIAVTDWLLCYEQILDAFIKKGHVPPAFTKDQKCIAHCIGPVMCCPCLSWSVVFRGLFCPFLCLMLGPKSMCAANSCTRVPDAFINEYYHSLGANIKVPFVYHPLGLNHFTDSELDRYIRVLRRSLSILSLDGLGSREKKRLNYKSLYYLADACFHCVPAKAPDVIGSLLINAFRERETRTVIYTT